MHTLKSFLNDPHTEYETSEEYPTITSFSVSLLVLPNKAAGYESQPTEQLKTMYILLITILSGDLHNGKCSVNSPET